MLEDSFFEAISSQYKNELPFVVYCKPYSFDILGLLQKDDTLYKINDFTESGFVFSPFDFRKDSILIPFSKSQQIKLSAELNPHGLDDNHSLQPENDKAHHIRLIEKTLECIHKNEFQKLVVSRKEIINLSTIDVIRTLKRLLISYNGAFAYCWFHPKVGLWIGATPESLIKIDGNRIETMALAGTQVYKGSLDVNWSEKDKNEHQFVTQYIIDVIKPYVAGLEISDTKTVRAGPLVHLRTDITANILKGSDFLNKLLLLLHPTPAVCGLPKIEAIQFIIDNEGYNREFYTGFLGELNKEAKMEERSSKGKIEDKTYDDHRTLTDLYVNLRCMQLQENKAVLYIGGGITSASDPEMEWEETVHKAETIKNVIAF